MPSTRNPQRTSKDGKLYFRIELQTHGQVNYLNDITMRKNEAHKGPIIIMYKNLE